MKSTISLVEDMTNQLKIPFQYGEYYDRFADDYLERQKGGLLYFNNAIDIPATMGVLESRATSINESRVLDVGSGLGQYSKRLAALGAKVTAIDVSARMTEVTMEACKGLDVLCLNQDFFSHNTQKKERYDYVVAGFMLGYFADLERAFAKFRQITKRGSVVIISSIHPSKKPFRSDPDLEPPQYFDRSQYISDFLDQNEPIELSRWLVDEVTAAAYDQKFAVDQILEPRPGVHYDSYGSRELYEYYWRFPSVIVYVLRRR